MATKPARADSSARRCLLEAAIVREVVAVEAMAFIPCSLYLVLWLPTRQPAYISDCVDGLTCVCYSPLVNRSGHRKNGKQLALVSADRLTTAERARLINAAYADYYVPLQVASDQVTRMDQAYDVDLARSVIAVVGAEAVGLTLLGRRGARGWIHSVGTVPPWRRLGIARAMVAQVVCAAAEAGVEELYLEVLTQNTPAHRLYTSLGFRPARELLSWQRPTHEDSLSLSCERIVPALPSELYDRIASWQAESCAAGRDERPCWQREVESLAKFGSSLRGYWLPASGTKVAASTGEDLWPLGWNHHAGVDGCCLVSENGRSISIMAVSIRPGVDPVARAKMLLQAICTRHPGQAISLLNVSTASSLSQVLPTLQFTITMRQLEMVLYLR
jgi:ribosomal protein S18 acetylase RimI-like enzyme